MSNPPVAKIALLIRKPLPEVFNAFASPVQITKFWFDRSSGPLQNRATVRWYWDLYDAAIDVRVVAFKRNNHIRFQWRAGTELPTTVDWRFEARSADTTYLSVVNEGFSGERETVVGAAIDSTGGFALVLAAAKAYLEHGVRLNIVEDRF